MKISNQIWFRDGPLTLTDWDSAPHINHHDHMIIGIGALLFDTYTIAGLYLFIAMSWS